MSAQVRVQDLGDFYIATVDGMEFTGDKESMEWGHAGPYDNWEETERRAQNLGIKPESFWPKYRPILDAAVGWYD